MRAILAVGILAALLSAGCATVPTPDAVRLPGLDAYTDCPVVGGLRVPCVIEGDSHVAIDTRPDVPMGWTCMTYSDQRSTHRSEAPQPDWYTYYGPFLGDGGSGAGEPRMGIYYDSHDDADVVAGALVLATENVSRVYTWEGPPAGFVLVPATITETRFLVYGILYPASASRGGQDHHGRFAHPGIRVESNPPIEVQPFWSLGPFRHSGEVSGWDEPEWQWDLVLNTEVAGQRLHLPTERQAITAFGDSKDRAGAGHWGHGRAGPFNATVQVEGLRLNASLQPYMEFYAEVRNPGDPALRASLAFLCGCDGQPLTSAEGARCLLGLPP